MAIENKERARDNMGRFVPKLPDFEIGVIIELIDTYQKLSNSPARIVARIHRYIVARFDLKRFDNLEGGD